MALWNLRISLGDNLETALKIISILHYFYSEQNINTRFNQIKPTVLAVFLKQKRIIIIIKKTALMFFHMIEHDRTSDKSLATERTSVRPLPSVISPMNSERGRLCEALAAHGTKIRSLSSVYALMNDVILAMGESFATNVTDQRSGLVYTFVCIERLDGGERLIAGVAGKRRGCLGLVVVVPERRLRRLLRVINLVRFRVVVIQVPRFETHETVRTGEGFLAVVVVHLFVLLEERPVPKARLAPIAREALRLLIVLLLLLHLRRWHSVDLICTLSCVGHLVHPQMVVIEKRFRTVPTGESLVGLRVLLQRAAFVASAHVVIKFNRAAKLKVADRTEIGLGVHLHRLVTLLVDVLVLRRRRRDRLAAWHLKLW